ncbi:sulfatase [Lentisphaera profundi]|uniref:Sulfatase n=1 Tax=Lentisphaera profundi TaxID=1658616 RepID=A0ABY7VS52_9BACT|nr:sulfatase [Lentisphaera profundi]WDE96053.1 sulfatase [Lentisphaera profundi]
MKVKIIFFTTIVCLWTFVSLAAPRPNVVLIMCDDLNDYISGMGSHPQVRTPNLEKFAKSAVAFKRAYSNNPVCAPSRASIFTGIYPHQSKNLFWQKWYQQDTLKHCKTMMEMFKENGYHVVGSGKLLHHNKASIYTEFHKEANYGPFWKVGKDLKAHPDVPAPFSEIGAIDGSYGSLESAIDNESENAFWFFGDWKSKKAYNATGPDRDPTPDEYNAKWAAEQIAEFDKENIKKPFFLSVGFIRPHTPLHVPQKYFDMFPQKDIILPEIKMNDKDDTFYESVFEADQKGLKYFRLLKESYPNQEAGLRAFTQAYLACITAVDENIGQVIDAVDKSRFKDNTIVIFTSDHGWNMGEKDFLFKNSLWEESARIPFIIRAPKVAQSGMVAEQPISLIDLYPTLVDLCSLEGDNRKNDKGIRLSGFSIRPFLEDPKNGEWQGPNSALTMVYAGPHTGWDPSLQHWTLRSKDWRYIRYNNGKEELYKHDVDPGEHTNLAMNPEYTEVKEKMKAELIAMAELDFSKTVPSTRSKENGTQKKSSSESKKSAVDWKKAYFKKNPSADSNKDGDLSWSELQKHKNLKK